MTDQTPDPTCAACGHLASEHTYYGCVPCLRTTGDVCLSESDVLRAALRERPEGTEAEEFSRAFDWAMPRAFYGMAGLNTIRVHNEQRLTDAGVPFEIERKGKWGGEPLESARAFILRAYYEAATPRAIPPETPV